MKIITSAVALFLALGAFPPAAVSAVQGGEPRASLASPAADLGPVRINEGAWATNDPHVTVSIAPPTTGASVVRLSNDGISWVERPYQPTLSWSLVDGSAGGVDTDGQRTVHVEYGSGGAWTSAGSDWIYLDRVAPSGEGFALSSGAVSQASWLISISGGTGDELSGVDMYRLSIDGGPWSDWTKGLATHDFRSIDHGGSWRLGTRTVSIQIRDLAGNVSKVLTDSIEVTMPPLNPDEGKVPVRFEFPRKAVTGELFTIRPIYPDGYVLPANAWCTWRLHWGDEESLFGVPNENWGELIFERAAGRGGCGEWTFTLPGVASPRFAFGFTIVTKAPGQTDWGEGEGVYESPGLITAFTASAGSTNPHIISSSIPLVYVLPETTMSQKGDAVTYRLHASGGHPIPQSGQFWTYPIECYINPQWSQTGGVTFTYRPNCHGNWVTGWTGTYMGGYMRSQYDPVVDGRAPTVGAPVIRLAKAGVGSSAPVTVSWSGRDADSGVHQYQLQRSRNGGRWTSVTLPSRLATTVRTSLAVTGTTRYRVRARDRVGNWSAWKLGPTVRGAIYQESYRYLRWTGAWTREAGVAWSGGAARVTTVPGATSTFSFNGRSVAWVARTGPTRGLVRVWLDGVATATVDLRSATVGSRAVQFATTWSALGKHSIRIENLGTDGSPGADVDAFLLIK